MAEGKRKSYEAIKRKECKEIRKGYTRRSNKNRQVYILRLLEKNIETKRTSENIGNREYES